MNKIILTLILLVSIQTLQAQGITWINLSYKVILNPANGLRPPGVTDADIDKAIAEMNAFEEAYWRGYRFRRTEPVREIGGLGQFTNSPSQWYNTDFFLEGGAKNIMESAAMANPNQYLWREDAINIYINSNTGSGNGGLCSFPSTDEIIILGRNVDGIGWLHLHEVGHFFNLCHTQGCPCGNCNFNSVGTCHTTPGNDGIDDTILDLQCWSRDQIAQGNFGSNYNSLNNTQKNQVDNVYENIMSYHGNIVNRMTEDQLDRWADATLTFGNRRDVVDRGTFFVATSIPGGSTIPGSSGFPFTTLTVGVQSVPDNSVLVIKPGAYNEALTITKPVSLRATRDGFVTIGSPTMSGNEQLTNYALIADRENPTLYPTYFEGSDAILDFAGSQASGKTLEEETGLLPKVYPNPTQGILSVEIDEELLRDNQHVHGSLYNIQGEFVSLIEIDKPLTEIDLNAYPKGVYYVKISKSDGNFWMKKFIYQ